MRARTPHFVANFLRQSLSQPTLERVKAEILDWLTGTSAEIDDGTMRAEPELQRDLNWADELVDALETPATTQPPSMEEPEQPQPDSLQRFLTPPIERPEREPAPRESVRESLRLRRELLK